MKSFLSLFVLFFASAAAFPVPEVTSSNEPARITDILCKLPVVKTLVPLCPRQNGDRTTVTTPLGTAKGTDVGSGATRFVVKYASASRWEHSSVSTTWQLPDNSSDPAVTPKICAQPWTSEDMTEDCLSMTLFVPPDASSTSKLPVMVWIHGGSFIVGSGSATGLTSPNLAVASKSIVAVIQYRLGTLGFMAPDGKNNLAVEDAINALKFIKTTIPSFGGDPSKVTVAGQSSGATLVRSLLAAPSASSLFKNAILQSDTMDVGFLSTSAQNNLRANFVNLIGGCSSSSCWNSLSLDDILDATTSQFFAAASIEPQAGSFAPIRMVKDGTLITNALDTTENFPSVSKSVLITTVNHEAGHAIFGSYTDPLSVADYQSANLDTFGSSRTSAILNSNFYVLPVFLDGQEDARPTLETIGTDYIWKCSSWTFARLWAAHGGKAYVGLYSQAGRYPSNEGIPFCQQDGAFCHEDDIQVVFGTIPSPSSAQSSVVTQMQSRYKSFLNSGNPNADGFTTWNTVSGNDVRALNIGGTSAVPVDACDPSFWGSAVQYDYQVYNI